MKLRFFSFLLFVLSLTAQAQTAKVPVFIYAGQSNADGREYVQNLPDYMKVGESPYSPYTHLKWASICGNPTANTFGTRSMKTGERYAFCDVTNYWIDQAATSDFYAIKCAYGGTAIAPNVTAEKLPVWYADATWMETHHAYAGQDITQEAYRNNNSLTKNLTDGFVSLVDNVLAAIEGGYDVKAIMWHQGESDRNAASSYYQNFKTMIAYMRQAIYEKTGDETDKTLPFIFGTVCRRSTQYNATVEAAQKQVASEDPDCYLIDMKNATLLSDNLHFDRQATEYLGKKMYNQLLELGLVGGSQVDVEEFPVKESVMDGVSVPTPDNRSWDFTSFSQATQDALSAEVALTSGALWNQHNTYGYRYSGGMEEVQLHTSADYVISEAKGLFFSSPQGNRVTLNTGNGYMVFVTGDPTVFVPKLTAGQLVTFTVAAAKNTIRMKLGLDMADYADVVGGDEVGTTGGTVTFRVKYNVTLPTHIGFQTSDAAYIKKIEVKTPETVNILIGADRTETFASSQSLDFSPFTDLFKAYVVTGYDDASGVVDMEQVLQVPANTGVVLMGEECEVKVPVIEGDAPVLAQTNLLTAVVGSGTAPADSYVLTTSAGVTQFTKTATAKSLSNQAYLATLGSLNSYGFNPMEAKTEHVYDIAGGGILAKGTLLTFTDTKHHTFTDGDKSVDVYGPANATGLDGRFAFDNSGKWAMDDKNFRLGANSGNTLYCSVVSLVHGDRVKIEVTGNDPSNVTMTVLNSALRGVSANETITAGTIYVVEADAGKTVNLDLKMYCGTNRAGFTKITVWSSTETTPIYAVSTPTATIALQQVREGLYRPVVTLATETDAAITYYKGGDAAAWTALDGNAFEPSQKAEYQFKAVAPGFADSDMLTLALGYRYALGRTVVDLTSESIYTAATKDNSGFDWSTNDNMKKIFSATMPDGQVYGRLNNATAITGITLYNNNLDARYSYAKGVGLACNYGYWVKTTDATAYDFAEYESYNTTTLAETNKTIVYNPNAVEFKFVTLKTVRLYEPVEVATVTVSEAGYATYCSEQALDFTGSGVEAYYATANGDDVNFNNEIMNPAASTGLLLKAPAGTYEVLVAKSGTDVSDTNLLKANFKEKIVGTTEGCDYGKVFILAKQNDKLGFYRSNNGRTLAADKSYLYLDDVSPARAAIGFPFDSETSALLSVAASQSQPSHIYDLQGRSISAEPNSSLFTPHTSLKKGIYIVNGKKIIIK